MSKILELAKRIASTGGLETKTTETISGTYDSTGQQRLLSHAYTIGANLTITNGELILSRLADNGTGMTLDFESSVTLTGDGTLMLGDLGQGQPNQDFSASRITGKLPSTVFPTGHVLQVVEKRFTDPFTTGSTSPILIGDLQCAITPTLGSKILVHAHISAGIDNHAYFQLQVNIGGGGYNPILNGVANSSRPGSFGYAGSRDENTNPNISLTGLHSPATESVCIYRVVTAVNSQTVYINRTRGDGNGRYGSRSVSSITLMEIAG